MAVTYLNLPPPSGEPNDAYWRKAVKEQCEIIERHLLSEKPSAEFIRAHAIMIAQFCGDLENGW